MEVGRTIVGDGGRKDCSRKGIMVKKTICLVTKCRTNRSRRATMVRKTVIWRRRIDRPIPLNIFNLSMARLDLDWTNFDIVRSNGEDAQSRDQVALDQHATNGHSSSGAEHIDRRLEYVEHHVLIKLENEMDYCRIFGHISYYMCNIFMKLIKVSPF
ncbi:hypothetical protein IEQ34_001526 [Dendrobium chrysotoxum]|uniref:Uncharacterized protein n=1 Tax=Dendrobium chrysotoxum TaxID=161865 RepID=A0AAV7HR20_DENCH|nr:hypothetical protein IEQ34_001526 [Dendrobium chrysotoxum]